MEGGRWTDDSDTERGRRALEKVVKMDEEGDAELQRINQIQKQRMKELRERS